MSVMEGSSAAQRPPIICLEVPGPKESPLPLLFTTPCMHQSAVQDYTCLSSAGCFTKLHVARVQVSEVFCCIITMQHSIYAQFGQITAQGKGRGIGSILNVGRLWVCQQVEPIIIRLSGDTPIQWVVVQCKFLQQSRKRSSVQLARLLNEAMSMLSRMQ